MNPQHQTPVWLRRTLIGAALLIVAFVIVVPLVTVFAQALGKGLGAYRDALMRPDTRAAVRLTLFVVLCTVPLHVLGGLAAAWAVTRFTFRGRALLVAMIDLPLTVSPVVAGLCLVLLYGARGVMGPWLEEHDVRIIYAVPGLVLATAFVTFPFVARALIPLMASQGKDEEEAALTLGASGWQIFFRVTLPSIKTGLLYGVVLCTARALGEFGAVSIVSGHLRGKTVTLPLHVEVLHDQYEAVGAFAAASLLTLVAVGTLFAKTRLERRGARPSGHR